MTSLDLFTGDLDERTSYCYPQDAPSRGPENYVHGSRSWELFVSGMSGSATELLRFLATIVFPRSGRMEREAMEQKLHLERIETELNFLRKDLCAVSPQLN